MHFEWASLGMEHLITEEDVPETPWKLRPYYGTRYRTWDYPNADDIAYSEHAESIDMILRAMKIGGAFPSPWLPQEHLGVYLCTLNSVFRENGPYPFLNVPEPITAETWGKDWRRTFIVGDMDAINFFWIRW